MHDVFGLRVEHHRRIAFVIVASAVLYACGDDGHGSQHGDAGHAGNPHAGAGGKEGGSGGRNGTGGGSGNGGMAGAGGMTGTGGVKSSGGASGSSNGGAAGSVTGGASGVGGTGGVGAGGTRDGGADADIDSGAAGASSGGSAGTGGADGSTETGVAGGSASGGSGVDLDAGVDAAAHGSLDGGLVDAADDAPQPPLTYKVTLTQINGGCGGQVGINWYDPSDTGSSGGLACSVNPCVANVPAHYSLFGVYCDQPGHTFQGHASSISPIGQCSLGGDLSTGPFIDCSADDITTDVNITMGWSQ